jgi:hypothetical protein
MSINTLTTHQKALSINLDQSVYGTIAEIGAAQEVARWFFRVGAAAGSVAKTISAYDMQVSDEIYGKVGRYVSRDRLEAMLDREFSQLIQRLGEKRGRDTRFFAFCDTVSARNFAGDNECHGWTGMRFLTEPGGAPNTIILHINMLDDTNIAQQEAVGILGVNLIHSAFFGAGGKEHDLASLADNLSEGRLEIDLVDLSGPAFQGQDPARTGMSLIHSGLAEAVLFGADGNLSPPTETMRKRPAIIKRTSMRYSSTTDRAIFDAACDKLAEEFPDSKQTPVTITEFSVNSVHAGGSSDPERNISNLQELISSYDWVMLTRLRQSYRLRSYLRRYSRQPLRFVMGVSTFAMLLSEKFYVDSNGGILEATGKLFADDVKLFVYPMSLADFRTHLNSVDLDPEQVIISGDSDIVSIHNLSFQGPLRLLHQLLMESGWVENLTHDG